MGGLEHGGGLDRIIAHFGGERSFWLDLSTGINPAPYGMPALTDDLWHRLPERTLLDQTLEAARDFYGVPGMAGILAAPGTQSLIQLLPGVLPAGPVAVLSPTYGEHAYSFRHAGRAVVEIEALADLPGDCTVAVVVNPNNPDGRVFSAPELLEIRKRLAGRGGCLIVDEAFADCGEVQSTCSQTAQPGLVVLKSFGKFFGLAGLRLGFAIADVHLVARLETRLGPWAVSGPALAVAQKALTDVAAVAAIRRSLCDKSRSLENLLRATGLNIAGSTRFFILTDHPEATQLHQGLCRHGIYVRKFEYAPRWLRFGLPASDRQFRRLEGALTDLLPGLSC